MQGGLSREVLEVLKRLVEGLEAAGVSVDRVYVFGSRVRGVVGCVRAISMR